MKELIEMDFARITDEQLQDFDTNGFLVVPQAIDAQLVDSLIEATDRLMKTTTDDSDPSNVYVQRREHVVQEATFDPLISSLPVVPIIVQILGPNIHLHTTSLIYKKPHKTLPERCWHRDIGIANDLGHAALPRVGIKACYCLTDFLEPHSGMTLMARGSQHNNTPLSIPAAEVDPVATYEAHLHAGDAILFENRVFHSAAPNLSNRISKAIIYGYAYRWMKPDINLDVPDDEVLSRLTDDIDRQLLGACRQVDAAPQALADWTTQHKVKWQPSLG